MKLTNIQDIINFVNKIELTWNIEGDNRMAVLSKELPCGCVTETAIRVEEDKNYPNLPEDFVKEMRKTLCTITIDHIGTECGKENKVVHAQFPDGKVFERNEETRAITPCECAVKDSLTEYYEKNGMWQKAFE